MTPASRAPHSTDPVVGVIDIGTNAVKLMVASVHDGRAEAVHFGRRPTRLGRGLASSGRIEAAAARRTGDAVKELAQEARAHGAREVLAAGTYALRTARNGRATAKAISRRAGVDVRILSGRREGELVLAAVRARLRRPPRHLLVVDIGGGSAQVVLARERRALFVRSVPLGAVVLTERFLHCDPVDPDEHARMQHRIESVLTRLFSRAPAGIPTPPDLVVSGGAATTASYLAGNRPGSSIMRITRAQLEQIERRCLAATTAGRRRWLRAQPDRADIMPAGLAVVLAFTRHAGKRSLRVFEGGWREGLILETARATSRSRARTRSRARATGAARTGR
jgi:exopolyphosphatase/guanosine-5'-triphosphate,3'-diphosphate pyrophosphatase